MAAKRLGPEVQKTDGVSEIPYERWDVDEYYDPSPNAVGRTLAISKSTKHDCPEVIISPLCPFMIALASEMWLSAHRPCGFKDVRAPRRLHRECRMLRCDGLRHLWCGGDVKTRGTHEDVRRDELEIKPAMLF